MSNIVIIGYGNAESIKFYELSKSLEEVRIIMNDPFENKVSKDAKDELAKEVFELKLKEDKRKTKSWQKNKFWE